MIFLYFIIIIGFIGSLIWFFLALKESKNAKKIAENWSKIAKAYPEDDFATINKAVKKLKKLEANDPSFLLVEAEKYLYGLGEFKDLYKVVELLKQIKDIKLPSKLPIEEKAEKYPHLKKIAEKNKKVKKRIKKEKYIKKIKKVARDIWNNYELWEIDHEIRRGNVQRELG